MGWRGTASAPRSPSPAIGRDLDAHRVREMACRDTEDSLGQRGREECRLVSVRYAFEQGFQILGEAHVEHLVGLVEHHHTHGFERECAPLQVIKGASWRRHHDLDAASERAELPPDRLATIDRKNAGAFLLAVAVDRLGNLHRELACGHQHERVWSPGLRFTAHGALEQRQCERRCLARPRRCLPEQIAPSEQWGDRLALDRRRPLVAELRQGQQKLAGKTKLREAVPSRSVRRLSVRVAQAWCSDRPTPAVVCSDERRRAC